MTSRHHVSGRLPKMRSQPSWAQASNCGSQSAEYVVGTSATVCSVTMLAAGPFFTKQNCITETFLVRHFEKPFASSNLPWPNLLAPRVSTRVFLRSAPNLQPWGAPILPQRTRFWGKFGTRCSSLVLRAENREHSRLGTPTLPNPWWGEHNPPSQIVLWYGQSSSLPCCGIFSWIGGGLLTRIKD